MVALVFIVLAVVFIAQGLAGFVPLPGLSNFVVLVFGIILFVVGLVAWLVKSFYIRPSANQAFVITGLGGRRVLIDSGMFFFPIVQQLVPVSLETMKLEVERLNTDALITKDNLRVDVRGEFYIKVMPNQNDVISAARSLGAKSVNASSVSALVFEKLVSALRSVAATKDLVEIHSQRDAFASGVQNLVLADLEQNGLTLESVTISRFDQTSQEMLSDSNIFDAQGKRKVTEITQAALVERNRLEQEAKRDTTLKNVAMRKEMIQLEREQAEAEAEQESLTAQARAARSREADTYRIEQEQQVRAAEIGQDEALKARAAERDRELVLRDQALQQTEIKRQEAIALSERRKEMAIAEAEREQAAAEQASLAAQAEREAAREEIATVRKLAEARRAAETKLIAAKQQIEEDRYREQTEAEVAAFSDLKKAEAAKQAAAFEAEAILSRSEAQAQAREKEARAETAFKRVDVDIERERVEVERQALENRQTYSAASLEFELSKAKIEAQREVQKEFARSIGTFMSQGDMKIFGSPETVATMMERYAQGLGIGTTVDGVIDGTELLTDVKVQELIDRVGALIGSMQNRDEPPPGTSN